MKSFVQMHKFWLRLGLTVAAAAILISSPAIFIGRAGATKQKEVGSADAIQRKGPGTGALQPNGKSTAMLRNYDVRITGREALTELLKNRTAGLSKGFGIASSIENNVNALRAQKPDFEVKMSELTGSPDMVESRSGALTDPAPGRSGVEVVRDYLKANAGIYGIDAREIDNMRFIGESASPSGLRMVRYEQIVNGIPVFQSETRAILTADGQMVRTLGLLVGGTESADPLTNLTSPAEALTSAMKSVGMTAETSAMSVTANREGTLAAVSANHSGIKDEVGSKLVYFAIAPGVLIPAWSQVFFTDGDFDWYTITDAQSGTVLWRKNIRADASTHEARFRVYVQADGTTPADSPAPHSPTTNTVGLGTQYPEIFPTIVNMSTAQSIVASPNGWINDCPGGGCTLLETQTLGNNVHAYLDRQGGANANLPDTNTANVIDGGGKPTGNPDANTRNRDFLGTTPRDFQTNFLPPPQAGNPESGQTAGTTSATFNGNNGTNNFDIFRRGVITQLFYITNWYHDQLYNLGFNEAAGNFQLTNFSGMGLGNDRVLAEAQDSAGTNNANFSTPPDGASGRMQMFVFTGPTIDRDGSLDAEIVMHELTHGTSNRLIGNGSGLNWDIGAGMGEGWSDFYALSLLNNTNADNPNGLYASGAYATYKAFGFTSFLDNYVYGIRRFPYTTDNSINPMTWADVDQTTNNLSGGIAPDPLGFNFGGAAEVHNSGEIWCLTLWEVRSRIIADPAGANGDVPTGNHTMLQLITDALKMTPVSPSFLDARDAIIAADGATHSYANEESIWGGFADRGLGYNAAEPIAKLITNVSPEIGIVESFNIPYLDKGTVTFSDVSGGNGNGSIDPGEQISISVPLKNPWHKATKGVASASATLSSPTAGVTIVGSGATYGAIAPQATTNGTSFIARIGSSVTCGQLLNFSVTTTSALGPSTFTFSFRVGTASGTGAPITYTKVESPGLAILDNQPTGKISTQTITDDYQIADVNVRIDSLTHTFPGDVVVGVKGPSGYGTTPLAYLGFAVGAGNGDNITNMVLDDQATGDTWLATNAQAPYTGSWKPYVNAPTASLVGLGPADAVGQFSRFNGTSPKGDWKMVVSDQFNLDAGTFNGWSLIITPVTFSCTPFVCPAPTVTCPANITTSNDPNQCGAVVSYPAPTVTSSCSTPGTVTCTPPSGSFFPVGVNTVNCSSTDDQSHTGMCSFTITVNDTQPPVITCPTNKTAVTPTSSSTCATVTFTATASDNCPGVTVVCNPPSGACFPIGTTTVTCTATDASSNTATCSFTVTIFNVCLQDDSNPATVFLGNSTTGAYRFCCGGTIYTGTATVVKLGNNITFNQTAGDRKVTATIDGGAFRGSGSLQSPPGQIRCSITDRDTRNNGCVCQ